jgi:hypothetical protein
MLYNDKYKNRLKICRKSYKKKIIKRQIVKIKNYAININS